MNITISFEVGYEDSNDLLAWLDAGVNGVPVKKKRNRKPMTDEEKKAFRERMVKGQEKAAKRRKAEEQAKKSKSTAKKRATTSKSTIKSKS